MAGRTSSGVSSASVVAPTSRRTGVVLLLLGALVAVTLVAPAPAGATGLPPITVSVLDVNVGSAHAAPSGLVDWNGGLYFSANDGYPCNGDPVFGDEIGDDLGEYGRELFTVGAGDFPRVVADVNPRTGGNCSGVHSAFDIRRAPMNDALIFTGNNFDTTGLEPYRTQGTEATTEVVRNIATGTEPSFPAFYGTVLGSSAVAFQAERTFLQGDEPWITDGTSSGTTLIADIAPGDGDSTPRMFTHMSATQFVFTANADDGTGQELYVSDGSGAQLVLDINPASDPNITHLTTFEGLSSVVFSADDGTSGAEPWVSNGTPAGTFRLADIHPTGSSSPQAFVQVGDQMFFSAQSPTEGRELWVTDGTQTGTRLVADVNPGTGTGIFGAGTPYQDKLYFRGPDNDLWFSNGTVAGTASSELGAIAVTPTAVGDVLFFVSPKALWATDGTPGGTRLLYDQFSENPAQLTPVGTSMLGFVSADATHGREVWVARIENNEPPVAVDDQGFGNTDEPLAIDVLANDTDESPATLTAEVLTQPSNGGAVVTTENEILYTPFTGFTGQDSFTYRACDEVGQCSEPATVVVTIGTVPLTVTITSVELASTGLDGGATADLYGRVSFLLPSTPVQLSNADDAVSAQPMPETTYWNFSMDVPAGDTFDVAVGLGDRDAGDADDDADINPDPAKDDVLLTIDLDDGTWPGASLAQGCSTGDDPARSATACVAVSVRSEDADQDGDGIHDAFELYGYDHDGDGAVDVDFPGLGANVCRPDVPVEMDNMEGRGPLFASLETAQATFDAATVGPLAGCRDADGMAPAAGINLIIDIDDVLPLERGISCARIDELWDESLDDARKPFFHWSLFADDIFSTGGGTSGVACGGGTGAFVVSLGNWTQFSGLSAQESDRRQEAGTFLHELGHTLGLKHGGHEQINYKPNYPSVMNYRYQMSGLVLASDPATTTFDYSSGGWPDLDEDALTETELDPLADRLVMWNNPDPAQDPLVGAANAPLDWNDDGVDSSTYDQDLNGESSCITDGPDDVLDSTPAGDDVVVGTKIKPGPDGLCDSTAAGDDTQVFPVGSDLHILADSDDWSRIKFRAFATTFGAQLGLEHEAVHPDESDADLADPEFAATLRAWETLFTGGSEPPVADAGGPYLTAVNTGVTLDATASSDPDVDPLTYHWTADPGVLTDSATATPTFSAAEAGIYTVTVEVCDPSAECDTAETTVTVYDPDSGFVTGAGWIDSPPGSCGPAAPVGTCDGDPVGRAAFAFVARYKKGAHTPQGVTAFTFRDAGLEFTSESYQWLVVSGKHLAQFKGTGSVNNEPGYNFLLTTHDGGSDGTDGFRIKISNDDDDVVYDNLARADDGFTQGNTQTIGGGNVVIHRK